MVVLLRKLDALAPPGENRDGDIPGFNAQKWVDLNVRVGVALTGIVLSERESDITITDYVISELERTDEKLKREWRQV